MTTLFNLSLLMRPASARFVRPMVITISGPVIDELAQRSIEGRNHG